MLPASSVAKEFLHCEMLFCNHRFKRWCCTTHLNILIFLALDAHGWASCFARSKVDILQNVQWHDGAVFNIMYFLYCSIHCTFYCWAIKQRTNSDWFHSFNQQACPHMATPWSQSLTQVFCQIFEACQIDNALSALLYNKAALNSLADHSTSIVVSWNVSLCASVLRVKWPPARGYDVISIICLQACFTVGESVINIFVGLLKSGTTWQFDFCVFWQASFCLACLIQIHAGV